MCIYTYSIYGLDVNFILVNVLDKEVSRITMSAYYWCESQPFSLLSSESWWLGWLIMSKTWSLELHTCICIAKWKGSWWDDIYKRLRYLGPNAGSSRDGVIVWIPLMMVAIGEGARSDVDPVDRVNHHRRYPNYTN